MQFYLFLFVILLVNPFAGFSLDQVTVGIDVLLDNSEYLPLLTGKRIGLITNHTAINRLQIPTYELLKKNAVVHGYKLTALFAPEHGIDGSASGEELIKDSKNYDGIPIFSLHGTTRRPTTEMLKNLDILVYDIQDIGSRSYTYTTTLFYAMEEAAKKGIHVVVLDRPNPINGIVIDGPLLEKEWRSFVGYINVPYCHGMTIGELAQLFNAEYSIGCKLIVIPMQGWNREMSFQDTGLTWIPTSPHIPESSTAFFYPMTGLLGELPIVSIGVGYTLPFKLIGAPWLEADKLAKTLNSYRYPGVRFIPFHFRPFYGRFAHEDCHGVQIVVTDSLRFKPVSTQYLIIEALKLLYPEKMKSAFAASQGRKEMFCKVNGSAQVFQIMMEKKEIVGPLQALHQKEKTIFLNTRKKYLLY